MLTKLAGNLSSQRKRIYNVTDLILGLARWDWDGYSQRRGFNKDTGCTTQLSTK